MGFRGDLISVRELGYSHALGQSQPAQQQLRRVRVNVLDLLPPIGLRVKVSGAQQNMPKIPWIAILDPDVTSTAQAGLYVVYLYDAPLHHVFLTMNQGATAHRVEARTRRPKGVTIDRAAIAALASESAAIRAELTADLLAGTTQTIDLGLPDFLPRGYEAGTIAAVRYDLQAMPAEDQLREDLNRFILIYQASVDARSRLTAANPERFRTPAFKERGSSAEMAEEFRPKDSSDYLARIEAHTQVKGRPHEAVLGEFGRYARTRGWRTVTNVHPRDLVLRSSEVEVLCEVKVVRANAQFAVREAIGQLLAYRHFLYASTTRPRMLAVFSATVGDAFVELLEELQIGSIWPRGNGEWSGSRTAADLGLV